MGQEPAETPAEGQAPEAPESKEGQEPQGPSSGTKTYDEAYVKQLRAEAADRRVAAQKLEERLEELEGANKSEAEKAQAKATKAEERAATAEAELLRYKVAQEKDVPAGLVPLLTATSREGLEEQAELILKNAVSSTPPPEFDGGARDPAPEPKTPAQAHDEVILRLAGLTPNN